MDSNLILYKNVFDRNEAKEITFGDFINNPENCLNEYDSSRVSIWDEIQNEKSKAIRNELKRNNLPAASFTQTNILSIDIDGIQDSPEIVERCIDRLCDPSSFYYMDGETQVLAVQSSVSGNIVAYFKYDCSPEDYSKLYYLIYLKITMLLGVNVDFLPDVGRLRYLSNGKVHYLNEDALPVTDMFEGDELPKIYATEKPKNARKIIYKSL